MDKKGISYSIPLPDFILRNDRQCVCKNGGWLKYLHQCKSGVDAIGGLLGFFLRSHRCALNSKADGVVDRWKRSGLWLYVWQVDVRGEEIQF